MSASHRSVARRLGLGDDVEVHVHLQHLDLVDHACMDLLGDWERQRERAGGTLFLEWAALERRYQRAG